MENTDNKIKNRQQAIDMTQGSVGGHLIRFALPMLVGLLFQQLYTTVDSVVVGQFVSTQALAAVGSSGSIINMLVGLSSGLSIGATVVISQRYGAHDFKGLSAAVQTTMMITFIIGVVMTIIGVAIVPLSLRMMDTPEDVIEGASEYLTIYFAGISGLMVYNMGSGILRAVGDSKRPLYFLCISALLNTGLDVLFVCVFHMGIAGVAYATILSQFISSILVLYVLSHTDAPYRILWRKLRIDRDMLSQILRIGLPAAVQQGVISFSNVFVQRYINVFGSACMAGWSSYNRIDQFIILPMASVSQASSTFSGQNFGAKKLDRLRKGVSTAMAYSIISTAALTVLVMLFKRPVLQLFNSDPDMLYYGEYFIMICSPFYVLCCFNQIYGGAMRGMNESRMPMIITISSFVVFRQIYLAVTSWLSGNFVWVALAYPVGWVLCSVLMLIFYRKCLSRVQAQQAA